MKKSYKFTKHLRSRNNIVKGISKDAKLKKSESSDKRNASLAYFQSMTADDT